METSVLRETDENEDPHGRYFNSIVFQPHVREVVNLIDRQICDEAYSPFLAGPIGGGVFSPQARLKLRTLSSTSSASGNSVFSSDASEGVCVSERAAMFESGEVGRHHHKTAEEREGRVLERDFSSDVVSIAPTVSSSESLEEEDVFGATIRPGNITRLPGSPRDNAVSGNASNPVVANLDTAMADLFVVDTVGSKHIPNYDSEGAILFDSSQATELASRAELAFHSGIDHGPKGGLNSTAVSTCLLNKVSGSPSQDLEMPQMSATLEDDTQPSHMSHMIAHEQAGRKPYGALRRAHSTPVPRLTEQQKPKLSGTETPLTPSAGLRTVSSCLEASPRQDLGTRVFSQGSLHRPDNGNVLGETPSPFLRDEVDTSRMVSVNLLKNSNAFQDGEKRRNASYTRGQAVSTETTERLAIAETRITELERLLVKALEENMILQKQSLPAENASPKSSATDGDHLQSSDGASTTILWRWFAVPQSLSVPFASRFGPPQTLGQLPPYVFLVGVGLSVIVTRVVLSRNLTRGK